jgi:hypothetical protein
MKAELFFLFSKKLPIFECLFQLSHITLPSGRRFGFQYDEDGGLRYVTLPSSTRHSFSCQPSLGFLRVTYTPPGSLRSYIQHYAHSGALLQTVFPVDGARVIYRYHGSGQLAEVNIENNCSYRVWLTHMNNLQVYLFL